MTDFYQIGCRIASGGFATVYRGKQLRTGKRVAIKKCKKIVNGLDQTAQARKEADFLKSLEHERVLKCFDSFEDRHYYYIVVEIMEQSLADVIKTKGRLEENEAAKVTKMIAEGV